jgi:uncharacterized protein (TIGR00730 family)
MHGAKSLLLFCGSRSGHDPAHVALAQELGEALAGAGIELIYGGGSLGLMGIAARSALAAGGRVTGIIPSFLDDLEVAQSGLTRLMTVETMHQRKALMWKRSDAVLALPGGIGTIDEVVETMSWNSLKLHQMPIYLMGPGQFWQPFIDMILNLERCGFNHTPFAAQLTPVETLPQLLESLARLDPSAAPAIGQPNFARN